MRGAGEGGGGEQGKDGEGSRGRRGRGGRGSGGEDTRQVVTQSNNHLSNLPRWLADLCNYLLGLCKYRTICILIVTCLVSSGPGSMQFNNLCSVHITQ